MARYSSRISNAHMVAVRFSSLGDVALTTGVLLRYHRQHGTVFTVVTRRQFAPLFDGNPAVDEVVGLEDDELRGPARRAAFRDIAARWQDSPLLDLHRNLRSALLAKGWRDAIICYRKMSLERRIFLWSRGRFCREALLSLNVPQRYASGLWGKDAIPPRSELLPKVFLTAEEREWAEGVLAPLRKAYGRVAVLHPFATHPLKTWPRETWLAFARLLEGRGIGCAWAGRGEEADFPGLSLVNKTGVRQLCALLGGADAVVTGDSAPMHLADAAGTPVLALFGPTTREWGFFPSGERDAVLELPLPCRPCSLHGSGTCPRAHACLAGIRPEAAADRLMGILDRH